MAFDKGGKYHMNPKHAAMSDKHAAPKAPMAKAGGIADAIPSDEEGQGDQDMVDCPMCGHQFSAEEGRHGAPVATHHAPPPMHHETGMPGY